MAQQGHMQSFEKPLEAFLSVYLFERRDDPVIFGDDIVMSSLSIMAYIMIYPTLEPCLDDIKWMQ